MMNNKALGKLYILFGTLALALELYGLKLLHLIDKSARSSYWTEAWSYAQEAPVTIAMMITVGIIIAGVALLFVKDK